jgi:hypothetical protein
LTLILDGSLPIGPVEITIAIGVRDGVQTRTTYGSFVA